MSYPQYPQPSQPQYPPQPGPYQPNQQYPPQQQQYAPPPPPPARGTIDDFYGQPAISGKSITFNGKPPNTNYTGVVTRNLTNADVIVQTDPANGQAAAWRDGRPKLTLVIPLQMQPTPEFPDGRAAWYCKANERAELDRAMEEAGLPHGSVPEQGGVLSITFIREVPTRPGLNARKEKSITYRPPQDAASTGQTATALKQPQNGQPPFAQPAAAAVQSATAQVQSAPDTPAGLTEEQQQLLARLRGQ